MTKSERHYSESAPMPPSFGVVALLDDGTCVLSVFLHLKRQKHYSLYDRQPAPSIRAAKDMLDRLVPGAPCFVINSFGGE